MFWFSDIFSDGYLRIMKSAEPGVPGAFWKRCAAVFLGGQTATAAATRALDSLPRLIVQGFLAATFGFWSIPFFGMLSSSQMVNRWMTLCGGATHCVSLPASLNLGEGPTGVNFVSRLDLNESFASST